MLFLSYECLFLWENVSKWSYSGFWPEALSVSRLQPLFVAIGKGNTKSRFQTSLCIPCVKMHSEKYLFQIQMHQNRWSLDNFAPCVHISITRLFHIHKSKGSYIMQMAIRRNAVSSQRTHRVTTPWGPPSIAKRKKGGFCLGMHICSIYGPSASFIIPNWHIFLDLFLLLQRSIQGLFSQWGSKVLGRFVIPSLATVRLIHPSTWRGNICSSADHLTLLFNPSLWPLATDFFSCLHIRQVRLSPLTPNQKRPIAGGFKTVKRWVLFLFLFSLFSFFPFSSCY